VIARIPPFDWARRRTTIGDARDRRATRRIVGGKKFSCARTVRGRFCGARDGQFG